MKFFNNNHLKLKIMVYICIVVFVAFAFIGAIGFGIVVKLINK